MSAGPRRAKATFWLLGAPDSLALQSRREPDGTGLGWIDGAGTPHVSKQPLAAYEDRLFAAHAKEVSARLFVAHVRFASTGSLVAHNTHPFEQDGRLFAHNGVVGGLDALERRLGPARTLVHGETDSERLFALITSEIAAAGGAVEAGIRAACAWVAENLPLLAINFVLIGPGGMWALRYPAVHDLFVLERSRGEPLEHASSLGTRVISEHGSEMPLVVLASERMDDDPGWRLLGCGELLHVSSALEVSSAVILDSPPAHPLSLADLDARARESQSAGRL